MVIAKTIVVNDAGEVLFLRRSEDDENRPGGWDFPGGKVDAGEDPRQAAIREADEEAGLALVNPLVVFGKNTVRPNGDTHCWLAFAEFVTGRPAVTLSSEHSEYRWMLPEDALKIDDYDSHHQLFAYLQAHHLLDAAQKDRSFTTCRVLLHKDGQILLAKRGQTDPFHPGTWDIPGGRCDEGEGLLTAAARETQEEVGVTIHDPKLVYAVSAPRPEGSGTWLFFVANSTNEPVLGDEHDTLQWVALSELPAYTDYDILLHMQQFVTDHQLLSV